MDVERALLEQADALAAELDDVESALRRMDEGTYGTCEVCGGEISDARLEAMPAMRLCARDAAGPLDDG